MASFLLFFFPLDVLDEIWYLIESVSEGFLTYFCVEQSTCHNGIKSAQVRAVFCDISKAFDRVWHAGLLAKLHAAGVTGKVHAWFADYLSDRKQRVVLPGAVSDWTYIRARDPQGSILGPLLFL